MRGKAAIEQKLRRRRGPQAGYKGQRPLHRREGDEARHVIGEMHRYIGEHHQSGDEPKAADHVTTPTARPRPSAPREGGDPASRRPFRPLECGRSPLLRHIARRSAVSARSGAAKPTAPACPTGRLSDRPGSSRPEAERTARGSAAPAEPLARCGFDGRRASSPIPSVPPIGRGGHRSTAIHNAAFSTQCPKLRSRRPGKCPHRNRCRMPMPTAGARLWRNPRRRRR